MKQRQLLPEATELGKKARELEKEAEALHHSPRRKKWEQGLEISQM